MEMVGVLLTSWPRMLVFLRLMVIPNLLQACAKKLMSHCVRLKQHLSYQYFANLSLCSETCKVSVASGVKVHTIYLTG